MKFLLLLAVILVVLWLLRSTRRHEGAASARAAPQPPAAQPQDMVECSVCAVHVPRGDALAGADGRLYCCAEHRRLAGG
jgi:uncharacterized protein